SGDDSDAVAARQFAEGEGRGHVEHVVEVLATDNAVVAEDRIVDRPRISQRTGVRSGGAPACLRTADLRDDDRLSGLSRLVRYGTEPRGITDTLKVGEKDIGTARIEQPVHIIMRLEAGLVAGARLIGETQLPRPAAAQKRKGQCAALAADRDRPAFAA